MPTPMPTSSPTVTCYDKVKKLQLYRSSKSAKLSPIQMKEFQVFSSGDNVAPKGSVYQSSDESSNAVASKAIDGSVDSYSSTSAGDSSPLWEVNFDSAYSIENVTILNHCQDSSDPDCFCGLSNFTLFLNDVNDNWIERPLIDTCNKSSIIELFISNPTCTQPPSKTPTHAPSVSQLPISSGMWSRSPTHEPTSGSTLSVSYDSV